MNILWLKSDLLVPLDKGGKLRTWHLLRHLARRHAITYLAFAEPGTPASSLAQMRQVATRIECVPRADTPKGTPRFYLEAGLHLLDPLPYAIGKYRSPAFAARVAALTREQRFDAVVCDFVLPAVNLPARLGSPLVIFTHNVESEIWRRHADTRRNPLLRQLYAMQYRRMLRFERRALARADGILAVSDADARTLARLYPDAVRDTVHVVPTGVDTEYFTPSPAAETSRAMVFTGSMDWLPNEDAMIFFCRDVLPRIRRTEPSATLTIVGREPTASVRRLAEEHGVVVTGRVEDVRPSIAAATVYVVPLRIGGGTRLKIFEAMAMGKAVVSTRVGAEGLPVTDGTHVLLADEPGAFADAVVALMRDPERRRTIEAAARTLVVEQYDWSAVAGALERALSQVASQGRVPVFLPGVSTL